MKEQLEYAIETLRIEFYRLALDLRSVPAEQWVYGFNADRHREQQRQIVEAILILGGDITSDMEMLRESMRTGVRS